MIAGKCARKGIAPSYFLEGLLYNVPSDKFGSSYEDTFVAAYSWMISSRPDSVCVCANQHYYFARQRPSHLDEAVVFSRLWVPSRT
jgi:hypothetical protein